MLERDEPEIYSLTDPSELDILVSDAVLMREAYELFRATPRTAVGFAFFLLYSNAEPSGISIR